jgi:hypothetical protein
MAEQVSLFLAIFRICWQLRMFFLFDFDLFVFDGFVAAPPPSTGFNGELSPSGIFASFRYLYLYFSFSLFILELMTE